MQGRWAVNSRTAGVSLPALVGVLSLALAALLFARPAAAVEATGLYRVTLPVPDRSQQARDAAFVQALGQVLVKVSGDSRIGARPAVQAALKHPASYVQQFAYQQDQAQPQAGSRSGPSGTPTQAQSQAAAGLTLQVRFDPVAIDGLLSSNKLPLWGRERPLVILWVGVNRDNGQRFILGSESDMPHPAATKAVEHAARSRGLPIFLPLMDLQDQNAVRFADLSGGFMGAVTKASVRYGANAVLAGVVQPSAGQWRGNWYLRFRGRTQQWSSAGTSESAALAAGIDGAADRLASVLAVSGGTGSGQQPLFVRVDGVGSIAAFARIEHMLTGLTPIRSARLVSADGNAVVFRVTPRGQASDVARNLGLVNWLQPRQAGTSAQPGTTGQTLYFQYQP